MDRVVHLPEEPYRFEVLPPAVDVRYPLPGAPGVIEVEHRGDRVHPQAVRVVAVKPEGGAAGEERPDLVSPEVEDITLPLGVVALAREGVFVEVGAVEVGEPVAVGGEVGRHPVEDHPDPALVEGIDEVHEVLRRAVPARGGEVTERLVAPGGVERVLHDREELDVREPGLKQVVHKFGRCLPVTQGPVLFLRYLPPRPEMHLVDGYRSIGRVLLLAAAHPPPVPPGVGEVPDDGCGLRRDLPEVRERVALIYRVIVVPALDAVLVERPVADIRYKPFPDAGVVAPCQERVSARFPPVEVPDDRDLRGVRRPDRKEGSLHAAGDGGMRPQLLVEAGVAPLPEEVDVVVGDEAPGPRDIR
ncbi:hypothetical protein DSECCO2_618810 [anaerobic digester metagenome]